MTARWVLKEDANTTTDPDLLWANAEYQWTPLSSLEAWPAPSSALSQTYVGAMKATPQTPHVNVGGPGATTTSSGSSSSAPTGVSPGGTTGEATAATASAAPRQRPSKDETFTDVTADKIALLFNEFQMTIEYQDISFHTEDISAAPPLQQTFLKIDNCLLYTSPSPRDRG